MHNIAETYRAYLLGLIARQDSNLVKAFRKVDLEELVALAWGVFGAPPASQREIEEGVAKVLEERCR